jgi:hypothetical protein
MEKTAIITRTVFKDEYDSSYGKVYNHTITLDNGDEGVVGTKDKMPAKLNPGKEITYTIEKNQYGFKIKLVKKEGGTSAPYQGNNKSSNFVAPDHRINNISFAMSYAKDLIVAGAIKFEKLEETFLIIYNAMDKKFLQIKAEQPKPEEQNKSETKKEDIAEKSTPDQYKRAEKLLNEGTLFSKEERSAALDKLKACTPKIAEGMITKLIVTSNSRKSASIAAQEETDELPF